MPLSISLSFIISFFLRNMHIHEVVFMVVLTIVAIVWIQVFRSFINTQIEAKSYDAIQKYAAEQKNIDGDFV